MKGKKLLAGALILSMAAGILGGCTGKEVAENETLKLEMMVCNDGGDNDVSNYMIVKKFQENFNIDLKLTQNSINSHLEKLDLLAAANELPDIISPLPEVQAKNYGSKGALVPVDKYLDIMPDFKKYIDADKVVYTSMLANDGHFYSIPKINLLPEYKWCSIIRSDLVEETGKEMPATMEELIEVLSAIKEKHPNIVGVVNADKMNFLQAYGVMYNTNREMFYDNAQDKWVYGPTNDGYRELIEDFNEMHQKGILDKEFFTASVEQWEEKVVGETGVFTLYWVNRAGMENEAHKALHPNDTKFNLKLIKPLMTNHYAKQRINKSQEIGTYSAFGVSSKVKNVERVMKAINYLYTDEGANALQWGEEGVHYTMDGDRKKFMDHVKISYNPNGTESLTATQGINSQHFMRLMKNDGVSTLYPDAQAYMEEIEKSDVEVYENNYKIQLTFTEEEEDQIRVITTNLETFVEENTINFIIGTKPISEYDSFIQNVKASGAQQLEQIYAEAYKRYLDLAKGV